MLRRHHRLTAVLMWAVMAAISVAGFAAFEADPPEPPTTAAGTTIAKSMLVGAVGTSDALPSVQSESTTDPTASPTTAATYVESDLAPVAEDTPPTPTTVAEATWIPPTSVERWRPLLLDFFAPSDVERALRVMWCESRGEPGAVHPTSGATGLFQHLPEFWDERSAGAGFDGRSAKDPEANIAVAGWLVARDGWRHWLASKSCWDR
ncbi:MAG: transglycosylase SLT domain-containing protein [Acidimicrobiia bacterium]|nr:transglycosylase SLT domain-containing protein [Acidimicrobiia bacterium]